MRSILLLIGFFPFLCSAQLTDAQTKQLRILLAEKVNKLRTEHGAKPLLLNDTLRQAALDQSTYMSKKNVLSHEQTGTNKLAPKDRVLFYKGTNFDGIGENVLYSTPQKVPLAQPQIELLAEEMFQSWKNSPPHFANMINTEYTHGDFGFSLSTAKKTVYATQVFGRKGISIGGQLSPDGFKLKQGLPNCDTRVHTFMNLVTNLANDLEIEGNEVKLYYHNINYFNMMFSKPEDGMAIDLVARDQVACGRLNRLDMSPVYDGILLKPIYKKELLENNSAESKYRVITTVGVLPPNINGSDYTPSIILIQDGKACRYLVPGEVPSANYDLRPIDPILEMPVTQLRDTGIVAAQELVYDFQTNITKPIRLPKVKKYPFKASSVIIHSYSSVEGDSIKNAQLHGARAASIQSHLLSVLTLSAKDFRSETRENWDQFRFQLSYFGYDSINSRKRDSIRSIISRRGLPLNWDSILLKQRRSSATVTYHSRLDPSKDSIGWLVMNLRSGIINKDFKRANLAMYLLFQRGFNDHHILLEPLVFDAALMYPELVQNYSALLSYICENHLQPSTLFLSTWANRFAVLKDNPRSNLIHLYTLLSKQLVEVWDLDAKRLSQVIPPSKIVRLSPVKIKNELNLNLHLTFIHYFSQINDGAGITKSFDYISNYFRKESLRPEDDLALALFFNKWSRYDMTIRFLSEKHKKLPLEEEAIFTLLKTMCFYEDGRKDAVLYASMHDLARKANTKRWCKWMNENFQNMRDSDLKFQFCQTCETMN